MVSKKAQTIPTATIKPAANKKFIGEDNKTKVILYSLIAVVGVIFIVVTLVIVSISIGNKTSDVPDSEIPDSAELVPSSIECSSNAECASQYGASYYFCYQGKCWMDLGGGGSYTSDTNDGDGGGEPPAGVTGFFAKFFTARTTAGAGTPIYYDAGYVGIGTNAPNNRLSIVDDQLKILGIQSNHTYGAGISLASLGENEWLIQSAGQTAGEGKSKFVISDQTNRVVAVVIENKTGNVGIGTSTPTEKLDVRDDSVNGSILSLIGSGTGIGSSAWMIAQGRAAFGYNGTLNSVIISDAGATKPIEFITAGARRMYIGTTGNVGIGTTAPTEKLDVAGTAKAREYCINSSCITSWPAGGTTGTSQWTTSGTSIYYNSGKVGIGTATPTSKLGVYQDQYNYVSILPGSGIGIDLKGFGYGIKSTSGDNTAFYANGYKYDFYGSNANANNYFAGAVGIGTTAPAQMLNVIGAANITLGLIAKNVIVNDLAGGDGSDYICIDASGQLFRKSTAC